MSSAESESAQVGQLIERLIADAGFRAEFRRDPARMCRQLGLDTLATELDGGETGMHTLELRESRSSLAGVVMAIAAEGVAVTELRGLVGHGLHGPARAAALKALHGRGLKAPRGLRPQSELSHLRAAERQVHGGASSAGTGPGGGAAGGSSAPPAAGGAPAGGTPAGGAAQPAGGSPAAASAAGASAAGASAAGAAASASGAGAGAAAAGSGGGAHPLMASAAGGTAGSASSPSAAGAAAGGGGASGWPSAPAGGGGAATGPGAGGGNVPGAGAGGAGGVAAGSGVPGGGAGGAGGGAAGSGVPGGGAAVPAGAGAGVPLGGGTPAGGVAGAGLAQLLESPRLSLSPSVRALFARGDVDPRVVSVLENAVAHHSIVVGGFESVADPVHAQSVDIVSVDGEPVGPANLGARDLVTEIAALDPGLRPNEIGTPWPIQSPGFFSDPSEQARVHLAFVSPADYQPAAAGTPGAMGSGPVDGAVGPVAATPAAQGAAQAAAGQLSVENAPGQPMVAGQPAPQGQPIASTPAAGGALPPTEAVPGSASPAPAASSAAYVNPLPSTAQIGRTDMGVDVDLHPGDPIVAPGTSRVLGVMPNWYAGQPYVALQLLDGPMKGHNYYVAEQINLAVSAGQIVQQGQPIAHYASSGTGIEMGWAGPNWEQTLAQAEGNTGDASHNDAPAGLSFRKFLDGLPHGGSAHPADSAAVAPAGASASAGGNAQPVAPAAAVAGAPPAGGVPAGAPTAAAAADSAGAAGTQVPAGGAGAAGTPPAGAGAGPVPAVAGAGAAGPVPAGAGAGTAGTAGTSADAAAFNASTPHDPVFVRSTVKFMAAVQPGPESPLYGQSQGAGQGAGALTEQPPPGQPIPGQPIPGQPIAGQPVPGQAIAGQPAPGQGAAPVPGQDAGLAAVAPTGGAISVSSSLLTSGQEKFAARLAELTGLDPRVVSAWALAEESGGAAQARQAAGNFNWLNIGYFDSGAGRIAFDNAFSDPVTAAEQTANFLKGRWGGASSSIRAILDAVGQGPQQQMSAIANSDWASSHYGGGANLRGTYGELSDIQVTGQ